MSDPSGTDARLDRIEDLEAKLAECEARLGKAVEALRMIANIELTFLEECRDIARDALAEIKAT